MFNVDIIRVGNGSPLYYFVGEEHWCLFDIKLVILAGIAAYFIGNISPSILMAKAKGLDIRKEGSGNAGTTNALRVMGKKAGVITLAVDILKGYIAVLAGGMIGGYVGSIVAAGAVFCGHVWPVLYRFKGGKGVATAFGMLMGVEPLLGLSALAVVLVFVLISKRMSVGSIIGAIVFPGLALKLEPDFFYIGIVIAIMVIIKHRSNIVRLLKKEEPVMSIFLKGDKEEEKA